MPQFEVSVVKETHYSVVIDAEDEFDANMQADAIVDETPNVKYFIGEPSVDVYEV